MIFRQLFDPVSSTYTYILACNHTGKAIIIDPVYEQFERDTALLRELDLELVHCLDTHVHADHVTAAWHLHKVTGASIALAAVYDVPEVTLPLSDGDRITFGEHHVDVMATPGHTSGCLTFVSDSRAMAFTGDCLLVRGAGRTDFQAGDAGAMWHSIRDRILALPSDCLLYPAHDYAGRTVTTVNEERLHNPRFGGDAQLEDFLGYMNNMELPHPKLLDIAVPANLHSGRPDGDDFPAQASWAPIVVTFAGVPEVDPDWVATHYEDVSIIDVRSAEEFSQSRLEGSLNLPIDHLRQTLGDIPRDKPVVAVCQSGKRSAIACQILQKEGFEEVANLPGGLIHWARLALPRLVNSP